MASGDVDSCACAPPTATSMFQILYSSQCPVITAFSYS